MHILKMPHPVKDVGRFVKCCSVLMVSAHHTENLVGRFYGRRKLAHV